jgi:parvulin-like peptidyl-prolyl isomerase
VAKREKKRRPAKMTRKYRSRVEQEQRQIRYILWGTGIVVAISIILLLTGLYQTQVTNPAATRRAKEGLKSLPAVTVNGTMISIADWQARVRYERLLNLEWIAQIKDQLSLFDENDEFGQQMIAQGRAQMQEIQDMLDLGDGIAADVLDQMVEEQLIRQEAARRGIVVTPEELQKHIEVSLFFYPYPPTSEPSPTIPPPTLPPTTTVTPEPTLTPRASPTPRSREDFEASYARRVELAKDFAEMSEEQWRSMVEGQLYSEKLLEAFGAEIETEVQQIKGSYIAAREQETARALWDRLDAGETFEALVEEIQADESEEPVAQADLFDWLPLGIIQEQLGTEFAAVAFNTDAGHYARGPILAADGQYYLVYVEENEVRELTDYLLEQQRQEHLQSWLDQEKLGDGIVYSDWRDYIPREP